MRINRSCSSRSTGKTHSWHLSALSLYEELTLNNILKALENPTLEQIISIDEETRRGAQRSLDRMFELS